MISKNITEKGLYEEEWISSGNNFVRERTGPTLNLWRLPESDSRWMNGVYSNCYSTDMTRRGNKHRSTFDMVLTNLLTYDCPLVVHLDRHHLAQMKGKPKHIAINSIGEICRSLEISGYVDIKKGYIRNDKSTEPTMVQGTSKLYKVAPIVFKSHIPLQGVLDCRGFGRPPVLPPDVTHRINVARQHNLLHDSHHQLKVMYKGDFRCHGRFYGDQVQYLKSDKRAGLRLNGEPVVEIDVQSSIPFIFHAMHIGNVPDYDIYYHDSVPRDLFKLVYMLALNCKSRKQAQTGLQGIINKTPEWKSFRARELLRDLETRISNVSHLLYSELGIRLMNVEAECMTSLLSELNRLKIKRHPIHDSIICAKSVASQVEPIMSKAFTIKGYPPILRMKHYEQ